MELLWQLPSPWAPDAFELLYVFLAIVFTLVIMVVLGAWWSR